MAWGIELFGTGCLWLPNLLEQTFGCGSSLNRRGKPQVLVHVSTYQASILVLVF